MCIEIREKIFEDGTIIKQRLYTFGDGLEVWCPEKACLFCRHCNSILYDWHGPYGYACELDPMMEKELFDKGYKGECDFFDMG